MLWGHGTIEHAEWDVRDVLAPERGVGGIFSSWGWGPEFPEVDSGPRWPQFGPDVLCEWVRKTVGSEPPWLVPSRLEVQKGRLHVVANRAYRDRACRAIEILATLPLPADVVSARAAVLHLGDGALAALRRSQHRPDLTVRAVAGLLLLDLGARDAVEHGSSEETPDAVAPR